MNIREIRRRVEHIDSISGDDEVAHYEEDELHRDVLEAIADGAPNGADLAREALRTRGIRFDRYYA
ncbi:hypothetical protein [Marinactinospora rubrisoli]|uniref:Uncharacterized protein n=1 Tax=Marinactinospora rubrisoli TaxID=2715399 RepID=A0ABW2KNE0_9ACTN